MEWITNRTYDEERALYAARELRLEHCRFDGPADGESALKECDRIEASDCFFNLRYPFWHDRWLRLSGCTLTPQCRAALWYSSDVDISASMLHGIKALRECENVSMTGCDIDSAEFGWSTRGLAMDRCIAKGEYFLLRCRDLTLRQVELKGKYSFQYIENAVLEDCILDTKDAFWHAKNVTVRNCTVKGEYLAWYSENVTFDNCTIIGTQPLCYCKGLRLIDCTMLDTDLSFERSEVEAVLKNAPVSIKNPRRGKILLPEKAQLIFDDPLAAGVVLVQTGTGEPVFLS